MSDDHSDHPAHAESVGRVASMDHCRLVGDLEGSQPLAGFLDPANLVRRVDAVAEHLARMPGDRHLVAHTSWALCALNVLGWVLVPAVVLAAAGVSPPTGWLNSLGCVAAEDVGPFDLLVRAGAGGAAATEDLRPHAEKGVSTAVDTAVARTGVEDAETTAQLVGLARELMAALHRAGCPESETLSAAAGSLGSLARQAGAGSPEALLARAVWGGMTPGFSTAPGDPEFRRPTCCGLMALARTDAACCPDCPRR